MSTVKSPPSGVPLPFEALIPVNSLGTASAIRVTGTWSENPLGLSNFDLALSSLTPESDAESAINWSDASDYDPSDQLFSRTLSFPSTEGEIRITGSLTLSGGNPEPGSALTLIVRSAQVPSGSGALTIDTMTEPVTFSDPVEMVRVEILTWEEWYILTGRDESQSENGS